MNVDVWVADLDALPWHREDWSTLSPDEIARANRFRFDVQIIGDAIERSSRP